MPGRIVSPALGPAHNGEEVNALRLQPGALLTGGKGQVRFCPFARPKILWPIKRGGPHPIFEREIVGVANAYAPLLWRVNEKQAAEGPKGLAPQRLFRLLVNQNNALTGICEF